MATPGSTTEQVLDAALTLFNERGSNDVTTRDITRALGSSDDHVPSREDLIRALFERLAGTWDEAFPPPSDTSFTLTDVVRVLHARFDVMWRYRFFYRETLALLQADPDLACRYATMRERSVRDTERLLHVLVRRGLLQVPASHIPDLARLVRLVSDQWLTFKALGSERVDPTDLREGVHLTLSLLRPYFTSKARDWFVRLELARQEDDTYHARVLHDLIHDLHEEPT